MLASRVARGAPPAPNVIVVVVDTLRADRVGGPYHAVRGLTPFLDELAARGTRFARAYAPTSWTCPSVASLLTSRYPSQHGVARFDAVLPDSEVTLAESLAVRGYHSAGFTANFRLTADLGYAQGFAFWDAVFPPDPAAHRKVRGDRLRADLESWLLVNHGHGSDAPLFLYVQYLEPHAPYDPPEPFRSRLAFPNTTPEHAVALNAQVTGFLPGTKGLKSQDLRVLNHLYDGEVAAVDEQIRQLFAVLDRAGVLRDAVIVITADHGEEFGEHGEVLHGHTLYDAAIRVPLIIVAPGYPNGQVVKEPVSLLDVAPTILALAGVAPEARHEGRSLLPLMRGDAPLTRPIVSELEPLGGEPEQRVHSAAILSGGRKMLLGTNGAIEVYDLDADPGEQHVLPPLMAAESSDLLAALDATRAGLRQRTEPNALARTVDDATKEKLRALGYQF